MKRTLRETGFSAIRVESGLLPPEYLQTISALEATHQANADYGLTKSLNIKDEMGRYWRIAADLWSDYKERRARGSLDVAKTALDTWLKPLLQEVLGYHDFASVSPVTLGERTFPISHTACGGAVPFVLTGHTLELDRGHPWFGEEGRRRPPHGLIQEYLNAAEVCLWGIVANGNRIRLVRDNPSLTRPAYLEADLER